MNVEPAAEPKCGAARPGGRGGWREHAASGEGVRPRRRQFRSVGRSDRSLEPTQHGGPSSHSVTSYWWIHQHDGIHPAGECPGPESGEPPPSAPRSLRQHGSRDVRGPRAGVPAESPAGQPLHPACPPSCGQARAALAPALPGAARDRRQEPLGPGAQLRGHRCLRQPGRLPAGDGVPHGPRVCGEGPHLPQRHHEDGGVQGLPHPPAQQPGEHRAPLPVLPGGTQRGGPTWAGRRLRRHEELLRAAQTSGSPGKDRPEEVASGVAGSPPGTGSAPPGTGSAPPGTASAPPGTASAPPGTGMVLPGTGAVLPGTENSAAFLTQPSMFVQ